MGSASITSKRYVGGIQMWARFFHSYFLGVLLMSLSLSAAAEIRAVGMTAKEYFGDTLEARLAIAAGKGEVAEVKRLVAQGADVNASGKENFTPLGWAMTQGSIPGMHALLEAGADPNKPVGIKKKFYPVWLAAGMPTSETLKLLLEFKADPNQRMQSGWHVPLAVAIRNFENVKLLVEAGADVNATDRIGNPVGVMAADLEEYDVVLFFLEKGFNQNLPLLAWEIHDRRPDGKAPVGPKLEPKRLRVAAKLAEMGVTPPPGRAPELILNRDNRVSDLIKHKPGG